MVNSAVISTRQYWRRMLGVNEEYCTTKIHVDLIPIAIDGITYLVPADYEGGMINHG